MIPLRINYASGVVCLWRPLPDVSDLTILEVDNPFIMKKLESLLASKIGIVDKVLTIASSKVISLKNGGPGKLFVIFKVIYFFHLII